MFPVRPPAGPFRRRPALEPIKTPAFIQRTNRRIIIAHIVRIFNHTGQTRRNAVRHTGRKSALGKIGRARKSLCIKPEQFFPQVFGVIGADFARNQVDQRKRIVLSLGFKPAFHAVSVPVHFKVERAAKHTALPGRIAFALVFIQRTLGADGQTVKHGFDKRCQCRLSKTVFFQKYGESRFGIPARKKRACRNFLQNTEAVSQLHPFPKQRANSTRQHAFFFSLRHPGRQYHAHKLPF